MDTLLQIALENAVQLKALASRDTQRVIAKVAGDPVMREILLRRKGAAWQFRADHETPRFVQILPLTVHTLIPIILLISAVKLEELELFFGKMGSVAE